jgi:hypothetical protein
MQTGLRESRFQPDSLRDELATDHRLHIMSGSPWLPALGAALAGDWDSKLWRAGGPFNKGDLLVTVLDTTPETILSLDRATKSETARVRAFHVEEIAIFTPLILTTDIETLTGAKFPALGPVTRDLAVSILGALDARRYQPTPQIQPGTACSALSTGQRAVALSDAAGRCAACDHEFGGVLGRHGLSGLDVHIQDVVDRRTGKTAQTAVVLCAGCHRIVHSAQDDEDTKLELSPYAELRYAWRPECPACGAKRAMPILWGMPSEEPAEDVTIGGCCTSGNPEQWECRECQQRWSEDADLASSFPTR